jgi:hypothetical protein
VSFHWLQTFVARHSMAVNLQPRLTEMFLITRGESVTQAWKCIDRAGEGSCAQRMATLRFLVIDFRGTRSLKRSSASMREGRELLSAAPDTQGLCVGGPKSSVAKWAHADRTGSLYGGVDPTRNILGFPATIVIDIRASSLRTRGFAAIFLFDTSTQ